MKIKLLYFSIIFSFIYAQDIYTEYLVIENDTIDVFSYQIPQNYNDNLSHPLLVTFHQWGGNQSSNYSTEFDEEANSRDWIMLSPYGGSSNNYNHQGAQYMVEQAIIWMRNNFNINTNQIYMVGGSMGGAAGAIYANNHLDPTKPMVAATASASGILDCERRAIEMDGNNSMIEWFGGSWDEFPFEYHRNSAVYFSDFTQSMHYNLQYTPLYLDFGVTEPHRTHAEDLYDLLLDYNTQMWIDTEPIGSHGYSVFDENHVCEWLSQFELTNNPDIINVNLDEPSRAYWIEAYNQLSIDNFIRINANRFYGDQWDGSTLWEGYNFSINEYANSDSLVLHILYEEYIIDENISFIIDGGLNKIGFAGSINITNINTFVINDESDCSSFDFNIDDNNIFWIDKYDSNGEICQSDIPYNISFNFLLPEEYDDINQDGIWNVIDIILIMNYILNINPLTNLQLTNADLNNDEIVDILDIVNLVNIILSE